MQISAGILGHSNLNLKGWVLPKFKVLILLLIPHDALHIIQAPRPVYKPLLSTHLCQSKYYKENNKTYQSTHSGRPGKPDSMPDWRTQPSPWASARYELSVPPSAALSGWALWKRWPPRAQTLTRTAPARHTWGCHLVAPNEISVSIFQETDGAGLCFNKQFMWFVINLTKK